MSLKDPLRQSRYLLWALLTLTFALLAVVLVLAWPFRQQLPAFADMEEVEARKGAFFSYLLPVVQAENARIGQLRERLLGLQRQYQSGAELGRDDRRLLKTLARRFESPVQALDDPEFFSALLRRVDQVPASLVLSQAAVESGWGRSRFARQGLNLFGHYCYVPGCGMVPRARPEGERFEVANFRRVRQSVRHYLRNLNSHPAYESFRQRRAHSRATDEPLSGYELSAALEDYSERGTAYVDDLRLMISANDLGAMDEKL